MKTLHSVQRIRLLKTVASSLAGALACFGVSSAQADILFHNSSSATFVPINAAADVSIGGATTFTFVGPGPGIQRVLITFNAECSIGGAGTNALDLDVLLDPAGGAATFAPVSPTGVAGTVLCSGNGSVANTDGRISASITVGVNVPAGNNRLRLRVTPSAGSGRLGARSLSVWR
jgi:hypothetical protein